MMRAARWGRLGLALGAGLGLAAAAGAQQQDPAASVDLPAGWRIGLHAVRPGDTLEGLSQLYTGGHARWRDNWRLNPQVKDPDLLYPGQRLQVLVAPERPPGSAWVAEVARKVEEKPNPNPWEGSGATHLLRQRDGVRTREDSSVELVFADDSELRVTENSLVFLQTVGPRIKGVGPDEVEIVEGQADLGARTWKPRGPAVDIVLGEARAKVGAGPRGQVQTRARRPAQGGAQLMVYEGRSQLAAAGVEVEVDRGMGANVPKGKPPAAPEPLLAAPEPLAPAAGAAVELANPELAWKAVPGAAHYTVEVCRDAGCGALVRRSVEVAATRLRLEGLPPGAYFWRATAVSASGLDGYPGAASAFSIAAERVDREPPRGKVVAAGRMVRVGDELVLGPGASLALTASDDASGLARVAYLLDGREVDEAAWSGAWAAGAHEAGAELEDRAANRSRVPALAFRADPDPPHLAVEVGGDELIDRYGEPDWQPPPLSRWLGWRQHRRLARQRVILEWSTDGRRWLPITLPDGAGGDGGGPAGRAAAGQAFGDHPQVLLRAPLGDPFAAASDVHLAPGEVLRLDARDPGCGVDRLAFGVGPGAGGGLVLWFESADLVGNQTALAWPLAGGAPQRR
jgi:LysM domain